jgi:N-acetylmuramic acid 6-phosphate (MurNAc-6-P) etherase
VFEPGLANGDTVVDFVGNGAAAGDTLVFIGYGPGATFTPVDADHWQVNYGAGSHDVITFLGGGGSAVHPSDVLFM